MPQRNLLLLVLAIAGSYLCYARGQHDPYCRYVASGMKGIQDYALDPATSRELFAGAMAGMIDVLHRRGDLHSQFIGDADAETLRNEIHQQFGGIGVRIRSAGDPPQLTIVGPIDPQSPAGRAKLHAGDRILKINDQPTDGLSIRDARVLLMGEPGSTLRLTIQATSDSKVRAIELMRELIRVDSLSGERRGAEGGWLFALEDEPRVAQVRIVAFGDRTALELADLVPRLLESGIRAIVLDVRDNSGGSLSSAVAVCEMWLPAETTIVETLGREQAIRERYTTPADGPFGDLPLAVIVNRNSASAAEIVAACLQDHHRAVVVGERSFGKGTVQQLLPLGKSLLKLTWARFRRPSGANVDRAAGEPASDAWGVVPDVGRECAMSTEQYAAFQSYRTLRDEIPEQTPPGAGGPVGGNAKPAVAVFIDEPLQIAKRHLQQQLDHGR